MGRKFLAVLAAGLLLMSGCGKNEQAAQSEQEASGAAQQTVQAAQETAPQIAPDEEFTANIYAMGNYITLTAYGEHAQAALAAAQEKAYALDALLWTENPESEIAMLNQKGEGQLTEIPAQLLGTVLDIGAQTGGALNPLLYPAAAAWGFPTASYRVPEAEEIAALLPLTAPENLTFDRRSGKAVLQKGAALSLDCVLKGYTAQTLTDLLRTQGVESAQITAGSTTAVLGTLPDTEVWHIPVPKPEGDGSVGLLDLQDCTAASAGTQSFKEDGVRYHSILDPATGQPVQNGLGCVTVVAQDSVRADALSAALFVMGPDKAQTFWQQQGDFEAVFYLLPTQDAPAGQLLITPGLEEQFTSPLPVQIIGKQEADPPAA